MRNTRISLATIVLLLPLGASAQTAFFVTDGQAVAAQAPQKPGQTPPAKPAEPAKPPAAPATPATAAEEEESLAHARFPQMQARLRGA